jgi:hypothetical protein
VGDRVRAGESVIGEPPKMNSKVEQ